MAFRAASERPVGCGSESIPETGDGDQQEGRVAGRLQAHQRRFRLCREDRRRCKGDCKEGAEREQVIHS